MNIWYFSHYAGGPGIGKAMRAYHLGRFWAELGHETTVFVARFHHHLDTDGPLPPEQMVGPVRYRSLPARPYVGNGMARILNMLDYCRAMTGLAREQRKPDVIIVTSPHPFGIFPAWRLARRFRAKLVFEVRDIWPLSITEINGTPRWHPFVLLCAAAERFAYRTCDLASSLLGNAEEHMLRRGLAPGRFVHVPNGVVKNGAVLAPPQSAVGKRAADQIDTWKGEGRAVIIHPGSQGSPNALDRLLDAVAVLNHRGQGGRFGVILLGEGGMTAALKAQAGALGLDNVAFFPFVPKAEALWLTARCDIGYAGARDHRRLYRYGISFNKIMDFMEAGLPVLLPLSAHGDAVTASGGGVVTGSDDPEDIAAGLEKLFDAGPEGRVAMGAKGRAHVDRFYDYRVIAKNYIEPIQRLA